MGDAVLVSGASGFVGSHLVEQLTAAGCAVRVVGRPSDRFAAYLARNPALAGLVDPGTVDGLAEVLSSEPPLACFHLASYFVAEHRPADVSTLVASNLDFPMRLADALAAVGPVTFVNVGTAWQHRAGAPYSPVDLYAATKQAFEDVLRFYAETRRLHVVHLKFFDTYGPRDPRPKLFSLLMQALADGTALEMSPGEQLIDLLHVSDAVQALLRAREAIEPGTPHSFAASSGAALSLRHLVRLFEEESGRPIHVTWGARPYRATEMFEPWDAGPPPPGWAPQVDLRRGIRQAISERGAG